MQDDIRPATEPDLSPDAYYSNRDSWWVHFIAHGVTPERLAEARAHYDYWVTHRPDLAVGDDWFADIVSATGNRQARLTRPRPSPGGREQSTREEPAMGNAYYEIYRNGEKIQAGYAVPTVCERDGCTETIDRGLGCLCGESPGGDEYGCGGYFCGQHLHGAPEGEPGNRCARCQPDTDGDLIRLDRRGLCPARVHFAPLDANDTVLHHLAAPPNNMTPCEGIGRRTSPVPADATLPTA